MLTDYHRNTVVKDNHLKMGVKLQLTLLRPVAN